MPFRIWCFIFIYVHLRFVS